MFIGKGAIFSGYGWRSCRICQASMVREGMVSISGKREVEGEQEVVNLLGGGGQWMFETGEEGSISTVIGEEDDIFGIYMETL